MPGGGEALQNKHIQKAKAKRDGEGRRIRGGGGQEHQHHLLRKLARVAQQSSVDPAGLVGVK